ncbi:MAG TPA: hypothetical protein VEV84_14880, partial [Pyrinomonadaceae bacterium]|nr:hypothetical protein [Pyrinomonadaceae bacterium]
YIATKMRAIGYQGITTNSTYDAWTPSRAYSHYHGGVRILSETASCKLATPITVKFDQLRPGEGYDPRKEAPNFGPVWQGGEWHIGDITRYMTTAAFSLLHNAADEREKWLTRFYEIGKEAVRPRKDGELFGFVVPPLTNNKILFVERILGEAGVEMQEVRRFTLARRSYPDNSMIIRVAQPYGLFAKAIFENQKYPDLKDGNGNPIPPYDVTAHTVSLLAGVDIDPLYSPLNVNVKPIKTILGLSDSSVGCLAKSYLVQVYRSEIPAIDEGWTRWVLKNEKLDRHPFIYDCDLLAYSGLRSAAIRANQIKAVTQSGSNEIRPGTIIFPDQSPNQILNGYAKGTMPDEYTGGVGKEGVENLKKFVEAGGTLVFLNRASDFAIEQFGLPVKDVTQGLARKDFYIPGSILRTELDTTSPIAKGMPAESIAWFENGPVFEVAGSPPCLGAVASEASPGGSSTENLMLINYHPTAKAVPLLNREGSPCVRAIARYPTDPAKILLSGWALGAEKIAGKAALVGVTYGKGKIILFGFRPQYRGQSLATFPLFFNAISN